MKVMFCHDTSDVSQKALEKTLEYFSTVKPEIILLTVVESPLDASMENEDIFEKYRQEIHDKQHKIAEGINAKGYEVDAIIATGEPRTMIMETVNTKSPDIVVIAKRGAGKVKELILGSVSAYVIRHSTHPVLVMPY